MVVCGAIGTPAAVSSSSSAAAAGHSLSVDGGTVEIAKIENRLGGKR